MERRLWIFVLGLLVGAAEAGAGDVTLRMRGGNFEVKGALLKSTGDHFVIMVPHVGRLSLRSDRYQCVVGGCPLEARRPSRVAALPGRSGLTRR